MQKLLPCDGLSCVGVWQKARGSRWGTEALSVITLVTSAEGGLLCVALGSFCVQQFLDECCQKSLGHACPTTDKSGLTAGSESSGRTEEERGHQQQKP